MYNVFPPILCSIAKMLTRRNGAVLQAIEHGCTCQTWPYIPYDVNLETVVLPCGYT